MDYAHAPCPPHNARHSTRFPRVQILRIAICTLITLPAMAGHHCRLVVALRVTPRCAVRLPFSWITLRLFGVAFGFQIFSYPLCRLVYSTSIVCWRLYAFPELPSVVPLPGILLSPNYWPGRSALIVFFPFPDTRYVTLCGICYADAYMD